jgi:transposase
MPFEVYSLTITKHYRSVRVRSEMRRLSESFVRKDMIVDLTSYPFQFFCEYFRRESSESGFSADKRCCGWKIWQRLEEWIQTAIMCKGLRHHLLWLGGS